MNGAAITLVRVKPLGNGAQQVFTIKGVVVDGTFDDNGRATGVRINGTCNGWESVDSWYAVGPDALRGSMCTRQTATLDLCGHEVTYGCDCDTIAVEAADQDTAPGSDHTCMDEGGAEIDCYACAQASA